MASNHLVMTDLTGSDGYAQLYSYAQLYGCAQLYGSGSLWVDEFQLIELDEVM